jgi:excinuclease UvrABC nuclease subunit
VRARDPAVSAETVPLRHAIFSPKLAPCLQHQIDAARAVRQFVGHAQGVSDATRVLEDATTNRRGPAAAHGCGVGKPEVQEARDQIAMLKEIQSSQSVSRIAGQDIDAVALSGRAGLCVRGVSARRQEPRQHELFEGRAGRRGGNAGRILGTTPGAESSMTCVRRGPRRLR